MRLNITAVQHGLQTDNWRIEVNNYTTSDDLIDNVDILQKILNKIISTSKRVIS